MSLIRLIIWSSLIGGWAAFIGWLVTEVPFHAWIDVPDSGLAVALAVLMSTFVAITIGGGVSLAAGLTNPQFANLSRRVMLGLVGGLAGGLLASLIGACVFYGVENRTSLGFVGTLLGYAGRVFGWTLVGIAVGAIEGLFSRDVKKLRNGVIGGALGGFLAGLLFVPVKLLIGSPMSSRALSFVLLGLNIGLAIGLAQVILKEAWLSVEAGFRPGRQMILGGDVITMGTSEKASLIFIAYGAKGVEPIHLKITKQPDGRFLLEDNQSRAGTLLNGSAIAGPTPLQDGDAIQFGVNVVRFNERAKHASSNERLPAPPVAVPTPAGAIQAKAPMPTAAIQPAVPKPAAVPPAVSPIQAAAPKPAPVAKAPVPAAKPGPAVATQPQEGRCPICDKKIVGIPGQRRCGKCFTTF